MFPTLPEAGYNYNLALIPNLITVTKNIEMQTKLQILLRIHAQQNHPIKYERDHTLASLPAWHNRYSEYVIPPIKISLEYIWKMSLKLD